MEPRPPAYPASDVKRERDARDAMSGAARALIMQAVRQGWREAEAPTALADAADDYVMYLAQKPSRQIKAANSN